MSATGAQGPSFEEHGGFLDARRAQGALFGDRSFQLNTWLAETARPVRWPVQVGRPPLSASAFQPRDLLRLEVTRRLARRGSPAGAAVVLFGDGGVGKTQLAAAAFRDAHERGTDLRVWVDASSQASILAAFAHAGAATDPGVLAEDVEPAAGRFLDWLAVTDKTWLMVLDDVADPAAVRGLWPTGPAGSVMATTRRRDLTPAGAEHVQVGVFTPEETRSYLAERLTTTPANQAAPDALAKSDALADALGRLPVAVAQAAAVILNDGITCAQYVERLRDRASSLDTLFPADATADEYRHTVAATWSLAIDHANALPPVGLARPALLLAAVVDPNGAPEEFWATDPVLELAATELGADKPATPAQMRSALRNLHRLSLITHDPAGGPLAVRTHALVQRATLDPMPPDDIHQLIRTAADAVSELWADKEEATLSVVLRRTTATLAQRTPDGLWNPEPHEILFSAGTSLSHWATPRETVDYWTDLVATATRVLGAEHPGTLRAKRNLVSMQGSAEEPRRAVTDMESILNDHLRVLGADDPGTLEARDTLAELHGVAEDPARAAVETEELLNDYRRIFGPDAVETFRLRANLAWWQSQAGDIEAAITTWEHQVADHSRALGANHPDTLGYRSHLAELRDRTGESAEAVEELEKVLTGYLATRQPDDLAVLRIRRRLAGARVDVGDVTRALAEGEQVLADYERLAGPNSLSTLEAQFALAVSRGRAGKPDKALADLETTLAGYQDVVGPTHRFTLWTRRHIAQWRAETGDLVGAVAALEELIADYRQLPGHSADDPLLLYARLWLARLRGEIGEPAGAMRELEELLAGHQQDLRPMDLLAARAALEHFRAAAGGDPAVAVRELTQLLNESRQKLVPDPSVPLTIRRYRATWKGQAGDPARAVAELEVVLPDYQRLVGPKSHSTLDVEDELAHWRQVVTDSPSDGG